MPPLPEGLIDGLVAARRRGAPLALLFDYDGTLAPFAPEPSLALLPPHTRGLLEALAMLPGVDIGVISGRPLLDLRRMVGLPGLQYAGTGGLEMEARGVRLTDPGAEAHRALMARVADDLALHTAMFPGAWVEDKGMALTLHYRHVPPALLASLLERAASSLGAFGGQVHVLQGPMAWEASPALAWDKGTALRAIVEACGPAAVPLYAGDSSNDAPALAAAAALGGVSIGVGEHAPAAQFRLGGPDDVFTLLGELAGVLGFDEGEPVHGSQPAPSVPAHRGGRDGPHSGGQ